MSSETACASGEKIHRKYEGPYPFHSYNNRKTFFAHIRDRIIPFSTSIVKIVHPDESEAPSTGTRNNAGANEAPPSQKTAQVPPEIASGLNALLCEYGDIHFELGNVFDEAPNAFLISALGGAEITKFYEQSASSVFATVVVHGKKDSRFDKAKIEEIEQLIQKSTYEFVQDAYLPPGATVLQSRYVLTIKIFGKPHQYYKARLIILGHVDPDKPRVANEAPTVLTSIRLAVSLIARRI